MPVPTRSAATGHRGRAIAFTPGQFQGRRRIGAWLGRYQALTSRNIRGSVLTDLALGGLNYQIEHHLFPLMPRPSLRHAQVPVRAFCAQHGIPYAQTGLLASYAQVLRHLHTTGRPARNRLLTQPPLRVPPLNRAHAEDSCGPRRRQAHTGDNEPLPRQAPAPPGNQPVQASRS